MPAKTSLGVDSSKGCWFTFTLGLTGLVTGVSVGEDAGSEANVFDGSEGGSLFVPFLPDLFSVFIYK